MLQNTRSQTVYEGPDQGLDLLYYLQILRQRFLYILIPFILVISIGFAVTMLLPAVYRSEGKILVESQHIPADLVRPTVTATANERLQVIEQRVLSRENLLAVVNKFQLFPDERQAGMSGTELLDLMRARTRVQQIELDQTRRRANTVTIALTVGFEHEQPDIATRVANDLVTLFLAEDARNRTNRATETTRFLAREVTKLETDLAGVDTKITEYRRNNSSDPVPERLLIQLVTLRAELQEKSGLFSNAHPDVRRLKSQVAALEQVTAKKAEFDNGLEVLQNQRALIQKNLEKASERLSAARLGESLERDQFSERLEVLEQAIMPQKPIKPNRPKILAIIFVVAVMAGVAGICAVELFNTTIRGRRDLLGVAEGLMIVSVPYIATRAEARRKKLKIVVVIGTLVLAVLGGLALAHILLRPLDELWSIFLFRLLP